MQKQSSLHCTSVCMCMHTHAHARARAQLTLLLHTHVRCFLTPVQWTGSAPSGAADVMYLLVGACRCAPAGSAQLAQTRGWPGRTRAAPVDEHAPLPARVPALGGNAASRQQLHAHVHSGRCLSSPAHPYPLFRHADPPMCTCSHDMVVELEPQLLDHYHAHLMACLEARLPPGARPHDLHSRQAPIACCFLPFLEPPVATAAALAPWLLFMCQSLADTCFKCTGAHAM
jgi:hypothetical protein